MSQSHIRVYIDQNWHALSVLSPMAYKVLLVLVSRADNLGRCFPSAEKIADDLRCHVDTVWKSLQMLEQTRYIGYLRRNQQDPITGRWMPNVYMVNPHFICIALECQEQALQLWSGLYSDSPLPLSFFSGTNQQQELSSKTNTIEPTKETNNNNYHPFEKADDSHAQNTQNSESEKSEKKKAKSQPPKTDSDNPDKQQSEASQRSKKGGGSAKFSQNYGNPDPIAAPIPDSALENLANRVNLLGVPIPLARGFIVAYGGERVESALLQLAATKRNGQELKNEAGFFRHILQNNLVDSAIPKILSSKEQSYRSSWNEFSEAVDESA